MKHKPLGAILIENKLISSEQLKTALKYQATTGYRLGHSIINLGYITEDDLMKVLEKQLGRKIKKFSKIEEPEIVKNSIGIEFCKKNACVPIKNVKNHLIVAMANPEDISVIDDLKLLMGKDIEAVLTPESNIYFLIDKYFSFSNAVESSVKNKKNVKTDIVTFVNEIIFEAIEKQASDIHLEHYKDKGEIRYRIDGFLYKQRSININDLAPIISRIKIMSNLNIAEKRLPQDGRIIINNKNYNVDIRVSIIPGIYGENVVLRILDKEKFIPELTNLGIEPRELNILKKAISRPYGLILVTGPTGSGKTTTLYSILKHINTPNKKIITIEDPVEYQLNNILQVEAKPAIGFDFARGLRSFLRHDPDIIMIGEIRDFETAEIAIRAALTGHLVLSTMHTNNAASAVTRLLDMNIEPFLLSSTLLLSIAQRLVRKKCTYCGNKKNGCKKCNFTGFKGRTGIFEIMEINSQIQNLITTSTDAALLNNAAVKNGMKSMKDNGLLKIKAGITTIQEVKRVI